MTRKMGRRIEPSSREDGRKHGRKHMMNKEHTK